MTLYHIVTNINTQHACWICGNAHNTVEVLTIYQCVPSLATDFKETS